MNRGNVLVHLRMPDRWPENRPGLSPSERGPMTMTVGSETFHLTICWAHNETYIQKTRTPQGFVVRCFTVSNRKDWFLYWDNFLQNAWPRVIGCVLLLPVSLVDLRRSVRSMEVKWGLNFQSGLLFSPWEVRGSTTIPNSSWCPSWQADLSREALHLL